MDCMRYDDKAHTQPYALDVVGGQGCARLADDKAHTQPYAPDVVGGLGCAGVGDGGHVHSTTLYSG